MNYPKLSVLALASTVLSQPGFAQDANTASIDEPILVIGSRRPIPLSEVTAAASILDAEQLELRGDSFVADALRQMPGIAVNRSGPAGGLTQVRIRGSEANHVLVLIDQMEASDPFTDSFNFGGATTEGVSRIEILRGEQSALWGTDAIGGVINISNEPIKDGDQFIARLEGGTFDTVSSSLRASRADGDFKLWGQVSGLDSDGYDVSGQNGERDGFSHVTGLVGVNLPLGPGWMINVRGRAQSASAGFDSDTDFDGRLNDVARELDTDIAMGRITLQNGSFEDRFQHEVYASYLNSRTAQGANRSKGQRTRIGAQTTFNGSSGSIQHHLTGLIEGRFETYENDGGPGAGQNQQQANDMWAGALDYQANAGPLSVALSARSEQNNLFADTQSVRAGLAWAVAPLNGRLRASFGQGVKNPGFFELFGFFPAFFVGNPDLQPEKSTGFELGWEQNFLGGNASITWFTADLENEIFTDFAVFPSTARNRTSDSQRRGVELAADVELFHGLQASGSMSFLKAEENNLPELRRPDFLASFNLLWHDPAGKWQVGLGIDHNGDMQDTDFSTFQRVTLPAFTLVRAKVSRNISDKFSIYLRGENLVDSQYQEVVGFAGQSRAIYGGVVARF